MPIYESPTVLVQLAGLLFVVTSMLTMGLKAVMP